MNTTNDTVERIANVSPAEESKEPRTGGPPKGFRAMTPDKHRKICSLGGKASHARGTAHEFTHEQASAAGKKGGATVSRDRAHMAEIGRKGARTRTERARARREREAFEADASAKGGTP
jgi:general stress protein YciG